MAGVAGGGKGLEEAGNGCAAADADDDWRVEADAGTSEDVDCPPNGGDCPPTGVECPPLGDCPPKDDCAAGTWVLGELKRAWPAGEVEPKRDLPWLVVAAPKPKPL